MAGFTTLVWKRFYITLCKAHNVTFRHFQNKDEVLVILTPESVSNVLILGFFSYEHKTKKGWPLRPPQKYMDKKKLYGLQITEILQFVSLSVELPHKIIVQHLVYTLLTVNHHTPVIYGRLLHIQKIILSPDPEVYTPLYQPGPSSPQVLYLKVLLDQLVPCYTICGSNR